jgi:AcrR family transcriptional regulator
MIDGFPPRNGRKIRAKGLDALAVQAHNTYRSVYKDKSQKRSHEVKVAATERQETGTVALHIARAAARLFAAQGYDATPVRAIVEAAGVTKPTLYYHFGSKEGLAQALLTVPMNRLLETQAEILESVSDPVRAMEALVESAFAFCREDPDRGRFVYALFFGPLASSLAAELARFGQGLDRMLGEATLRAAEAGLIAADRADHCAAALRGVVTVCTMDFLYKGIELGPGLAGRLVGDLLHGFGSEVANPRRAGPLPARVASPTPTKGRS